MIKKALMCALMSATAVTSFAGTEVKMLHIETTREIVSEWEAMAKEFEQSNPGIDIDLQFAANEDFKAKLPTLLQSKQRPDIFYSWGGGNFQVRADAGLLNDITPSKAAFKKGLSGGAVDAFTSQGKLYGVPYMVSAVGFWYNKELFAKAGIDANAMGTWSGFLAGVKKLKNAGVTPIAVGGADKWPIHFYWSYLVMRAGGKNAFDAATADSGTGFAGPAFVTASKELKRLAELEPFQNGYMAAGYGESAGLFGDKKAAMHLMGDWDYAFARQQSIDKKGVADNQLGWMPFPSLEGGKGAATDTLGGINGWALAKGAKPEAVKWLQFFLNKTNQSRLAGKDYIIPVAKGADAAIQNPFKKQIAASVSNAGWHQVFFDQALGADVGGVVNDISAELVSGDLEVDEALERVQEAWEMR